MMNLAERIKQNFELSIQTKADTLNLLSDKIIQAGQLMVQCLLNNNKMLCCGNGTSASVAQLFAANMLNRFYTERPSLPAIALTANTATITSIANDKCYPSVFAKQIKALGQAGDTLLAITSQDQNASILNSIEAAHQRNLNTIILAGSDIGFLSSIINSNDIVLNIPSMEKARVQETHLLIIHCLCDMIDRQLFETQD